MESLYDLKKSIQFSFTKVTPIGGGEDGGSAEEEEEDSARSSSGRASSSGRSANNFMHNLPTMLNTMKNFAAYEPDQAPPPRLLFCGDTVLVFTG
jgi:hypothetical protein